MAEPLEFKLFVPLVSFTALKCVPALYVVLFMIIKPSANIRQNYNEISALCKSTGEPIYLTKNGEGDLIVMDISSFTKREKMLKLREELIAINEDRMSGNVGCSVNDLENYLDEIISDIGSEKSAAI